MTQHFLLSRAAKTLSLAQVLPLSDAEAEAMFRKSAGRRRTARPSARIAAAWSLMIAAARTARRASSAAPAARISASPAGRCLPLTSCPLRTYLGGHRDLLQ